MTHEETFELAKRLMSVLRISRNGPVTNMEMTRDDAMRVCAGTHMEDHWPCLQDMLTELSAHVHDAPAANVFLLAYMLHAHGTQDADNDMAVCPDHTTIQ